MLVLYLLAPSWIPLLWNVMCARKEDERGNKNTNKTYANIFQLLLYLVFFSCILLHSALFSYFCYTQSDFPVFL